MIIESSDDAELIAKTLLQVGKLAHASEQDARDQAYWREQAEKDLKESKDKEHKLQYELSTVRADFVKKINEANKKNDLLEAELNGAEELLKIFIE